MLLDLYKMAAIVPAVNSTSRKDAALRRQMYQLIVHGVKVTILASVKLTTALRICLNDTSRNGLHAVARDIARAHPSLGTEAGSPYTLRMVNEKLTFVRAVEPGLTITDGPEHCAALVVALQHKDVVIQPKVAELLAGFAIFADAVVGLDLCERFVLEVLVSSRYSNLYGGDLESVDVTTYLMRKNLYLLAASKVQPPMLLPRAASSDASPDPLPDSATPVQMANHIARSEKKTREKLDEWGTDLTNKLELVAAENKEYHGRTHALVGEEGLKPREELQHLSEELQHLKAKAEEAKAAREAKAWEEVDAAEKAAEEALVQAKKKRAELEAAQKEAKLKEAKLEEAKLKLLDMKLSIRRATARLSMWPEKENNAWNDF